MVVCKIQYHEVGAHTLNYSFLVGAFRRKTQTIVVTFLFFIGRSVNKSGVRSTHGVAYLRGHAFIDLFTFAVTVLLVSLETLAESAVQHSHTC